VKGVYITFAELLSVRGFCPPIVTRWVSCLFLSKLVLRFCHGEKLSRYVSLFVSMGVPIPFIRSNLWFMSWMVVVSLYIGLNVRSRLRA
jgi:hypothetical protein